MHEHTILLEDALNSDKDGKVIHQIMKEVKKDFDARTIQGNSQGNLQDAKGQVFVHHIDFAKVKKTIEDWKKKRGNYQEVRQDLEEKLLRNAEVLQEDLKTLTQGEREALYLFYQKYTELREKKTGYSEQLKKVEDGKDLEDLRVKELSKERKVLNALEKIGWRKESMIEELKKYLVESEKENGENLLSILLGDEEFLKKINYKSKEWEERIKEFEERHRRLRTFLWSNLLRQGIIDHSVSLLRRNAIILENEVVLMIADRLITEMSSSEEVREEESLQKKK
ncbi:hypothetical protein [Mycoplasma suis]|uniref:Uncharacterized protein n=1 Tax=Mycoplasma suis (strain Illinois) TaxID=768700 RepID=F0QQF5_MYCSL|nr:hypothetical protein [Mycoplasma suis]ADX97725.1 hypothetical protein MSU_0181 [Mycoplasma suis str. Illinois]